MQSLIIREANVNDMAKLLQFEQGVIKAERPFDKTLQTDPINYYDIDQMMPKLLAVDMQELKLPNLTYDTGNTVT
ncbi:MAG: hypothetical protein V4676_06130 [Bacteroidota bacterium]